MSAVDYMNNYWNLRVDLDNSESAQAKIDKYLNHDVNVDKARSDNAWAAKDNVLGAIHDETKTTWKVMDFTIDGFVINAMSLVRVFTGKGSPKDVKDALWLAHRYGFITNPKKPRAGSKSLQQFTDAFCGLDCNGFVGNYLGVNPDVVGNTHISEFGATGQRLTDIAKIKANTTLVWVDPANAQPYRHIAVVDSVVQRGDPLKFKIVQSIGPDAEHGVDTKDMSLAAAEIKKDTNKNIYFSGALPGFFSGDTKIFFCDPIGSGTSNE